MLFMSSRMIASASSYVRYGAIRSMNRCIAWPVTKSIRYPYPPTSGGGGGSRVGSPVYASNSIPLANRHVGI